MSLRLRPWQLLAAIFAGWANDDQQQVIEYLRAENQILKEKFHDSFRSLRRRDDLCPDQFAFQKGPEDLLPLPCP